jgi:phospholipid/cholesterol/gamma-HCH transport system substrate-binding protein
LKKGKEIKIAILAIVAMVIFYLGFNYLKGINFFDPVNEYYTIYESIDGLTISNPVLLSGLAVGRVSEIQIVQDKNDIVKVYFELRDDITLGEQSIALLSSDLLGTQTIVIQRNKVENVLPSGSEVKGEVKLPLTEQIQQQAYPVLQTLDSVGNHLNGILENVDNNQEVINGILENVRITTASLSKISEKQATINALIDDFKVISGTLADKKNGLSALLTKANGVADSLNSLEIGQLVQRLDSTLINVNSLLASIQEGEGTVDKLLNDDSLYNNLNKTLESLDGLLIDFQESPKKYVHFSIFGKKDKEEK